MEAVPAAGGGRRLYLGLALAAIFLALGAWGAFAQREPVSLVDPSGRTVAQTEIGGLPLVDLTLHQINREEEGGRLVIAVRSRPAPAPAGTPQAVAASAAPSATARAPAAPTPPVSPATPGATTPVPLPSAQPSCPT